MYVWLSVLSVRMAVVSVFGAPMRKLDRTDIEILSILQSDGKH